uniref:DUF1829 domain-containing protein n=1 Tax=Acidaminococcus fermentans TaxID=905 RepID=UPI003A8DAB65
PFAQQQTEDDECLSGSKIREQVAHFFMSMSGSKIREQVAHFLVDIHKGNTGLEFTFSFQIAGRKREILINTFNVINKSNLTSFLFDWGDIKEGRERVSQKSVSGLAIINDQKKPIDSKYLDAIRNKGADYILYSERNKKENIEKLNANAA